MEQERLIGTSHVGGASPSCLGTTARWQSEGAGGEFSTSCWEGFVKGICGFFSLLRINLVVKKNVQNRCRYDN